MSTTIGSSSIAQTSTATSSTASTSSSTDSTASLATEQTFLKLLVAQLANQDPLQPTQGTDFVTQLAQFAQVEQSQNQTTQLTNMGAQLTGLSNSQTTSLVGKTVTIQGNSVSFDGTTGTQESFTLAGNASQISATISDSTGTAVRTMTLPASSAGVVPINWNGREDNGALAPAGTYSISVAAADANGNPVSLTQNVTGVVQSVSFAQGYAELVLASGATAPISQLVSVGTPAATQ